MAIKMKTMTKPTIILLSAITCACVSSCCGSDVNADANGVYIDQEFTRMYMPDSGGVTSADGTISFQLNDGSSIFMTGDFFTGDVVNGARDRNDPMYNNAFIHISKRGKYLGSIYGKGSVAKEVEVDAEEDGPVSLYGSSENISSLYVPAEADTSRVHFWYWPGHAVQTKDGTLYVSMAKLYQGAPGQWGFVGAGVDMLKVDPVTFEMIDRVELFGKECNIGWAQCMLLEGEDVWMYGTGGWGDMYAWKMSLSDLEDMFVSRKPAISVDENGLPEGAYKCEVDSPVSAQQSVFKYKGKYVLINRDRFSKGGEIYSYVSDYPQGPWENRKLIWCTTEQVEDPNLFTYNAMAHPQYINRKGELLICYNLNSYNVVQIMDDVVTYRPVFLRVPMSYIMK